MDQEAWFEMTPENVARYLAWRLRRKRNIVDACSGVGSNAIQFSKLADSILGIDSNPHRVSMCESNALVYNCTSRLRFICDDVMSFLRNSSGHYERDSCFHISPPWGGKECYLRSKMALNDFPIRILPLIEAAMNRFGSVVVHLPRNTDIDDVVDQLGSLGIHYFEIERIFYSSPSKRLKFYYLYIDSNVEPSYTLYSIGLDRHISSISSYTGSGWHQTIFREVYIKMTILGVYMCDRFKQFEVLRGVKYAPVDQNIVNAFLIKFPSLANVLLPV